MPASLRALALALVLVWFTATVEAALREYKSGKTSKVIEVEESSTQLDRIETKVEKLYSLLSALQSATSTETATKTTTQSENLKASSPEPKRKAKKSAPSARVYCGSGGCGSVSRICPLDFTPAAGRCYMASATSLDWKEARSFCENNGAEVLWFRTKRELKLIEDILTSARDDSGDLWTAGLYIPHRSKWFWYFRQSMSGFNYVRWSPTSDLVTSPGYICAALNTDRRMVALACSTRLRVLCRKDPEKPLITDQN